MRDNAGEYLSLYDGMKDKLDLHSDELSFHLGSTFDEDELEYLQRIASGTTEDGKYKRYVSAQVESRVMDISFSDWREGTDEFLASSSAQEIASRYLSLKTGELHADVRYDYYYARTDEGMLSAFARQYRDFLPKDEKDIEAVYDNFRKRFSGFCKNTIDYYETYRYFFSESEMAELMPRLRLASELAQVVLLEALDAKAVLGAIRSMIGTYTEFDPVLNYYAHLYGEYWKLKLSSGGIAYKENLFEYDVRLWKLAEKGKSYFPALIEAIDAAWWQGCVDQLAGSDNERNILSFLGIFDSYGENGNAVNYAKRQLRQRTIEISAEHYRKGEPVFVCRTLYGRDSLIIEEVFGFNDFIEEQMRLFEADIRAIMEQK